MNSPNSPIIAELQRITTAYVDAEDRVRLSGELAHRQTVVLWLTQRLLNRLVPHLTHWLEQQAMSTSPVAPTTQAMMQMFAQQAARAQQTPEAPVRPAPGHFAWRVASIELACNDEAVGLVFKGDAAQSARLTLFPPALRQWLAILYDQYRHGDWPTTVWPTWLEEAQSPRLTHQAPPVLH